MDAIQKPPLGIEPKWLHDYKRANEILDAIERYSDSNIPVPKAWVIEFKEWFNEYCNCSL